MSLEYGAINHGYSSLLVKVEVSLTNGLPSTTIVGLANKSVDESKERLRAAFKASGLTYPKKRILINLAPADTPKNDSSLDLSMAVAILRAQMESGHKYSPKCLFLGELGLDGSLRAVSGLIGKLLSAKKDGFEYAVIPYANRAESSLVNDLKVFPVKSLKQLATFVATDDFGLIPQYPPLKELRSEKNQLLTIEDVVGQALAKRAALIAVAGGHNLHLYGPPGSGKTMIARAIQGMLPALSNQQTLEVTHINSLIGQKSTRPIRTAPFRSPHHTASEVSIIGGGPHAKPGEISLAHHGVLMMDELPEYNRTTLEALRQPLEDKIVHVSRAQISTTYPADFLLVATSNPCPCGYYGTTHDCSCNPYDIIRYSKKLSGPIMDRIDMHVKVESVEHESILAKVKNQTKFDYPERINNLRIRQSQRNPDQVLNGRLTVKQIKALDRLNSQAKDLIDQAANKMQLSSRGYIKAIRVANTIADLAESDQIEANHVAEALQYRYKNPALVA